MFFLSKKSVTLYMGGAAEFNLKTQLMMNNLVLQQAMQFS